MEGFFYKGSFKSVKGLFQVNLENHVGYFAFHLPKMGDVFLNNYGIIRSSPVGEETNMRRANDNGQERFDPVH